METITRNIPVLALRGLTAFPGQTVSFDAERDISIFALDNAMENDRRLLAMTQKDLVHGGAGRGGSVHHRHGVSYFADHQDLGHYGACHRGG